MENLRDEQEQEQDHKDHLHMISKEAAKVRSASSSDPTGILKVALNLNLEKSLLRLQLT